MVIMMVSLVLQNSYIHRMLIGQLADPLVQYTCRNAAVSIQIKKEDVLK